ncbi:hypothetical protein ACHAWF_015863 [Thalassiosira exigua]
MDDDGAAAADAADAGGGSPSLYRSLLLSLAASASFWVQSVATEERLVPALNVVSVAHGIPDDVAGATLMAAGASSPELLCTLVSLFVTKSNLGLGTIVGSEIFNQLAITAGSVYASRGKALVLDRRMVAREAGFYGLSVALLWAALGDARADEGGGGGEKIYVPFWKAGLMVFLYVLYVAVCANTDLVEGRLREWWAACAGWRKGGVGGQREEGDGDVDLRSDDLGSGAVPVSGGDPSPDDVLSQGSVHYRSKMPSVEPPRNMLSSKRLLGGKSRALLPSKSLSILGRSKSLSFGGRSNLSPETFLVLHETCLREINPFITSCVLGVPDTISSRVLDVYAFIHQSFDDHELRQLPFIYNISSEPVENWEMAKANAPSAASGDGENDDYDIIITNSTLKDHEDVDVVDKKKRSFLSAAFHKSFKLIKANHLLCRDDYPLPRRDKRRLRAHVQRRHPRGGAVPVAALRLLLSSPLSALGPTLSTCDGSQSRPNGLSEGRRDFTLMAPSAAVFNEAVRGFEAYMAETRPLRLQGMTELDDGAIEGVPVPKTRAEKRAVDADPHIDLIELPPDASWLELALWTSVLPLRIAMHYTLPDVRHLDRHGQPEKSLAYAYLSVASCLVWLIAGSYVMVVSLETLAALTGIPDSVMGVTISAAGTSLPAYIASRIAAEKGFGNQAIANVFGSNSFNICIGLGLPWVMYTPSWISSLSRPGQ